MESAMSDRAGLISNAFRLFMSEAPAVARAWSSMARELADARALDARTRELSYQAVLAAIEAWDSE
jgi:alkylhydroperoxidase/carboxymuconolactone decarboxylase family protein YurZ